MRWFGRHRREAKAFTVVGSQLTDASLGELIRQVGTGADSSVLMAPCLWAARQIGDAVIDVVDDEGEPLDVVPLHMYLTSRLKFSITVDLVKDGNAYIQLDRNAIGLPEKMIYVPCNRVSLVGLGNDIEAYRVTLRDGRHVVVHSDDMIHIAQGHDPYDVRYGLSPLKAMVRETVLDKKAGEFLRTVVDNVGFPGVVVSPEGDDAVWSDDLAKDIKDYFVKTFKGKGKGEPLVLSDPAKVEALMYDLSKLGTNEIRKIPEERVSSVVGIAAAVVGFGVGLQQVRVGATLKEMRKQTYENVIIPLVRVILDEVEKKFLSEFDPSAKLMQNLTVVRALEDTDRIINQKKEGLITTNEARADLGRDPIEGGDELQQPTPELGLNMAGLKIVRALERDWDEEMAKTQNGYEKLLADKYKEHSELAKSSYLKVVREGDPAKARSTEVGIDGESSRLTKRVVDEMLDLMTEDYYGTETLYTRSGSVIQKMISKYARRLRANPELQDEFAELVLQETLRQKAKAADYPQSFRQDTERQVYKAIYEGRRDNLGVDIIADNVAYEVGAGPWKDASTRGRIVARTETAKAFNDVSREVMKAMGVQKVHITDGDDDPLCAPYSDIVMSIEAASGVPLISHPNCTRRFTPA